MTAHSFPPRGESKKESNNIMNTNMCNTDKCNKDTYRKKINKEKKSSITVRVTEEEKQKLTAMAAASRKSLNSFLVDSALLENDVMRQEKYEATQRIIKLMRKIDEIEDSVERARLKEKVSKAWQF